MKKLIALFLTLIIVFSLCGCNSNASLANTIWVYDREIKTNDTIGFVFNQDNSVLFLEAHPGYDENHFTIWWDSEMQYQISNSELVLLEDDEIALTFNYIIKNDTLTLSAEGHVFTLKKIDSLEKYFNENGKTIGLQGSYEWVEETKKGLWWW